MIETIPQWILLFLGLLAQSVAAVLAGLWFYGRRADDEMLAHRVLAGVGLLFYVVFLIHGAILAGRPPTGSVLEATFLCLVLFGSGCLALDVLRGRRVVGAIALPIQVGLALAGVAFSLSVRPPEGDIPLREAWVGLHVALTVFAYVAFLFGAVAGVLFLAQEREIKAKRMGRRFDLLPPLEVTDRWNHRSLQAGFCFLTLGLLMGGATASGTQDLDRHWYLDPKVVISLLTWGVYFVLLGVRSRGWLRGRKVAYLTLLSVLFLFFTFFGASFLWEGFHRF